jgi:hypothetical protein
MEVFFPTLESQMTALVTDFQFIVFAIMVTGLIFTAASPRFQGVSLFTPLLKAIVVTAALAYQGQWFPAVENVFLDVANYVDPGYNNNPTSSSDTIRQSTTSDPQGQSWSWRHLNESIYQAVTRALANVFIYIGTLITVPMLILHYILRWLLYLLTPFALAMFMVPGFSGIGARFFQQLLAIMAWPIGFALTNLVALAVWTDFRSAVGANPQNMTDAVVYSPLLTFVGGILATIVIIVGMISTPVVMQMLFSQGHAFTGASGNPATIVRTAAGMAGGLSLGRQAVAMPAKVALAKDTPPPPPMGMESRPGI